MPSPIRIHRCSAAAASLLRQQEIVGWVHSCYARIMNLRTPQGRLLTLQGPGRLQAPLALTLAGAFETPVPYLPVGALVVQWLPGLVPPPAALQLVCATATVWDGRVQPSTTLDMPTLAQRVDILATWIRQHAPARGLAPLLVALPGRHHSLSAICCRVYEALLPLFTAQRLSAPAVRHAATQAIGVGNGLTPSGDDLLVGLLAVVHATGHLETVFPVSEHSCFLQHVHANTTDLSVEFLRCALEGHFAEPLALLVRALCADTLADWQEYAAVLATVGHSSGIDAMVGVVLGGWLLARTLMRGNA